MSRAMSGSSSMIRTDRPNLFGDFASRALDKVGRLFLRAINDLRDFARPERLRQRSEGRPCAAQARWRRDSCSRRFHRRKGESTWALRGTLRQAAQEQLIESDFRFELGVETLGIRQNLLERGRDIGVARRLRSAQRARKSTQERECAARWRPRSTCRCSSSSGVQMALAGLVHRQSRQLQALPFSVVKMGRDERLGELSILSTELCRAQIMTRIDVASA